MGTRGLTMVVSKGKTKVAQYGQWDHYPSGQGATALKFLHNVDFKEFAKKLKVCKFVNKTKQKEIDRFLKSIGCENGWLNGTQGELYNKEYPYFTRDHGANILNLINESEDDVIWLHDQTEFAADSLFCEWAYVIDLDNRTFEVYRGFNQSPIEETERFAYLSDKVENDYGVIRLVKSYSFDELPTVDQFVKELEGVEVED
jgi:hypothetical protein